MFDQYAQVLRHEVPHLEVEGATYPPPRLNEILSNVVFVLRMAGLLLLLAGPGALEAIGIHNPPAFYLWAMENKVRTVSLESCSSPGSLWSNLVDSMKYYIAFLSVSPIGMFSKLLHCFFLFGHPFSLSLISMPLGLRMRIILPGC